MFFVFGIMKVFYIKINDTIKILLFQPLFKTQKDAKMSPLQSHENKTKMSNEVFIISNLLGS